MGRNKPFAAQQPAPAFANDPDGFWTANLEQNRTAGLSSLLPAGTVIQADVAAKGRMLQGQINWVPAKALWSGCNLTVSLSDAQFLLALEAGGDVQQGRLTILLEKLHVSSFGKGLPQYGNVFAIQAGGAWHDFTIVEMVGQYDDNDAGLTLFLEKEQDDDGD